MKITSLLSNLIVEASRFQTLYDKLVKPAPRKPGEPSVPGEKPKGAIPFETLKAIIFADPDTKYPEGFDTMEATPEQMESDVKVGKYTQWLVKQFINPKQADFEFEGERNSKNPDYKRARQEFERLFLEDLFKQTERLQFYERVKQYLPEEQRDINKLGIRDLFNIFSTFQLPEKKRKEEEKKLAKKTREGFKHAGAEIMYEGSNWVLIRISDKGAKGKDAAIYYGGFKDHRNGESDWCTSGPGLSFFEGYIKNGPLYVVFPQDDKGEVGKRTGLPVERYQFHFPSDQFMDRDDHRVDMVKLLNGPMAELKELFKEEFGKGLAQVGGTKVNLDLSRGIAAQFVKLYGFEDLFNVLPENVLDLVVKDNSNSGVAHPIPDTISRFKDLETVLFQNCVSSVPESIGECTKLTFLSFPNNPKLTSLPKSIAKLDLNFLNIRGCSKDLIDGKGIPPEVKEKLVDAGGDSSDADSGFYFIM